jgi:hypothetical protein
MAVVEVTPMESPPKICTDQDAQAWLGEHIAAPAESQDTAIGGPATFLETLIAYLSAYRITPKRGDEQPIVDRLRSFDGPARSFAGVVARLIVKIRDDAFTSFLGARLVDLPATGLELTIRRLKLSGIAQAVEWLATLDTEEQALRRPAPTLPCPRSRRRRRERSVAVNH